MKVLFFLMLIDNRSVSWAVSRSKLFPALILILPDDSSPDVPMAIFAACNVVSLSESLLRLPAILRLDCRLVTLSMIMSPPFFLFPQWDSLRL